MKKVAVIILNWNGKELLKKYLPSVVAFSPESLADVVVADNGSSDNSLTLLASFPSVKVLTFETNLGFAGGYNRAIQEVEAEYVLLLNSDVEVTPDWLSPLVEMLDAHPDVAAVQPKLLDDKNRALFEYAGASGGFIDHWGYPFCRGRILDSVEEDHHQYDEAVEVFWASGAALLIRRNCYLEAGGLDERFFAHQEEIDLCWRLKNRGWKIMVAPASYIYHLGGGSLPMNHPKKLFLNYRNNLLLIYKNAGKERRTILFVRWFLDLLSALLFLLQGSPKKMFTVFKAHHEFRKMKVHYTINNPSHSLSKMKGVLAKSMVWLYFIGNKKNTGCKPFTDLFVKEPTI